MDSKSWICLDEYYYSGRDERRQKTVSELVDGMEEMLNGRKIKRVFIDPSAAPLKVELRRRGYHTQDARNEVLDGISDVCSLLKDGNLAFMDRCENTIDEFEGYLWDEQAADAGIDQPLKENDHCMDALRYFVRTMQLVRRASRKDGGAD